MTLSYKYSAIRTGWKGTSEIDHPTGAQQVTEYWSLVTNYKVSQRLSLDLTIPYYSIYQKQPKTPFDTVERWHEGIGDTTLLFIYTLSNDPFIAAGAGVKMPTGEYKKQGAPVINGSPTTYPMNMQLGTGTWDPSCGLFYSNFTERLTMFGNILYRYTGGYNSMDNRVGDETLVNLGMHYLFRDTLGPMLMMNLFHTGKDDGPNTRSENTGVTYLFVAPGVIYAPTETLSFQGVVELPVYKHVNGIQVTPDYNVLLLCMLTW